MILIACATSLVASAQILSVFSGDGQVAAQNFQLASPLIVVAKNSAGQPMSGVTVNWSLNGPGNLVMGNQTVTDSTGQAQQRYVGGTIYTDTAYTQSTITASSGSSNVTMHVTTSASDLVSGQVFVQAQVVAPILGDVISGASGSVGSMPVRVYIYGIHNAGVQQVPNISIRLIPDNPGGPSVACAAGTGVTDVTGNANCPVVFSGPTGSSTFSIEVGGGFRTFSPFRFNVTQGSSQPSAFRMVITGGNNQTGAPGSQLPARLTARVENAFGNPVPNIPVIWQPSSSVSLSAIVSTSDAAGMVSASATLGSISGPTQVQVTTTNGAAQATFSLTVGQSTTPGPGTGSGAGVPANLRILSGADQAGPPGAPLPSPLTARVEDSSGNPLANIPVTWQPSSSVSVSNASSTSNANGIVSATAILGSALGPAQVQLRTIATGSTPFGPGANIVTTVFNLTVSDTAVTPNLPPAPALLRILGGDNQSGSPGAVLPAALTARVEDGAGRPLPNVPVTWQPSPSVSVSNASAASDATGIVSATVILGSGSGSAQVTLRTISTGSTPFGPGANVVNTVFNLTINGASVAPPQPSTPALLRILGGNNQTGAPGALLPAQLVARVEDAAGNPVPSVAVVWQPSAAVSLSNSSSTSDANGIASATVILGSVAGSAQVQLRTAANAAIQTTFSLTVTGTTVTPPQQGSTAATLRILGGDNQSGAPGSRLPAPLTGRVEDGSGRPVPNVAVIWETSQGVSLTGSSSTSDANGIVSATATLGPAPGPAQVVLRTTGGLVTPFGTTGGVAIQTVFSLTATGQQQTAGAPVLLRIVGGDNQSGPPGAQLSTPLTARIEDAAGNPVPNVSVVWQPVGGQPVSLTNLISVSNGNGLVFASAQLGSALGPTQVQVRILNSAVQATFNLAVNPAQPAFLRILGGDNQSGPPGRLPAPLTVRVEDSLGNPVPNVAVVWQTLTPQSVTLDNLVSMSDANGIVSASAILSSVGPAQVQVRVANVPVLTFFNLLGAAPQTAPNPLTFFNAFSDQPGLISPTEVLAIFGAGIAPSLQGCSTGSQLFGPLPLSLANVQVQFASDGYSAFAPLYSVCNLGAGQEYVRVQAPADLPLTATTVTVQVGGAIVAQSLIAAVPASPGILETAMSDGVKRAVLLRLDGSYVSLESPVQRGERLRAFVTGLGRPVTSSGVLINTNQSGTFGDDAAPPNPVTVRIAGREIQPVSSIYSAESIGVYVVTFDVPDDIQSGADVDFAVATLLGDQNVLGKLSKLPVQ